MFKQFECKWYMDPCVITHYAIDFGHLSLGFHWDLRIIGLIWYFLNRKLSKTMVTQGILRGILLICIKLSFQWYIIWLYLKKKNIFGNFRARIGVGTEKGPAIPEKCTKLKKMSFILLLGSKPFQKKGGHMFLTMAPKYPSLTPTPNIQ